MPMIALAPIGFVRTPRTNLDDFDWDRVPARIELTSEYEPEALVGLNAFSHAEIIFLFDRIPESAIERRSRHPRENPQWPQLGIFAQRGCARPNRLGATIVRIAGVNGRTLEVVGLDAADGSPVLDIKPVMREFLPRGEVRQPNWVSELMSGYWSRSLVP